MTSIMPKEDLKGWGLLQEASRDVVPWADGKREFESQHFFENKGSGDDDWHYFIEQDRSGALNLVAECNDSSFGPLGHFNARTTITFENPEVLTNAITQLGANGEVLIRGMGQVHVYCDYLQVGAP